MNNGQKIAVIIIAIVIISGVFYYQFGISKGPYEKPISVNGAPPGNSTSSNHNTTINKSENNNTTKNSSITVIGNAQQKYNYAPLRYGAIGPDLWNLVSANGNTTMKYIGGKLLTNSSFNDVKSNVDTILGYPEVAYGYNLEDQMFGDRQNTSLIFPVKFSAFERLNFTSTANFSFEKLYPSNIPIDFSYDLWLEQNPSSGNMPTSQDLEVMIWMYCQDNQPIGQQIGSFHMDASFNGNTINATWEIWYGKANAWPTVSFILEDPAVTMNSNISLNISKFIIEGGIVSGENLSNHTLMGIEMGNEFGNENLSTNISEWVLSYYSFDVDGSRINII